MQDAQEVMDMLVKVQNDQGEMEPDDPQVKPQGKDIYVDRGCVRDMNFSLPVEKKKGKKELFKFTMSCSTPNFQGFICE